MGATKDLYVWVDPTPENAARVHAALGAFGAPLDQVRVDDFATAGTIFQIGVEPVRIDIATRIDGLEFADGWSDRVHTAFGGEPAVVLSKRALLQNKRAAGRAQDLADIERLMAGDET